MQDFNVIVAGSRTFTDYALLKTKLDAFLKEKALTHNIVIVSGLARGADTLGLRYAKERGYKTLQFPADWDKFGKSAGYRRNLQMADVAHACVAFHADNSRGTADMMRICTKRSIPLRTVKIN